MKQLYTGNITDNAAMPIKKGTLDFLQLSYQELFAELLLEMNPNINPANVNVLRGGYILGGGTSWSITPGAVLFNGEIFLIPGNPVTSSNPTLSIGLTQYSGADADPVQFTDGNNYNVHNIRQAVLTDNDTSSNLICPVGSLIYTNEWEAIMSQSGTNAPTETTLITNTFPGTINIVWTRTGTGVYVGTVSSPIFTTNKTIIYGSTQAFETGMLTVVIGSATQIYVNAFQFTSGPVAACDIGSNFFVHVKVYN